jgi:hypothetical protein
VLHRQVVVDRKLAYGLDVAGGGTKGRRILLSGQAAGTGLAAAQVQGDRDRSTGIGVADAAVHRGGVLATRYWRSF